MTAETPHAEWRAEVPVVDAHGHFDPDRIEECVEYMDRVGVETFVDISPNRGEDLDAKLDAIEDYPGRFAIFAGVDYDDIGEDGWIERECDRIERAIDAGALGVKFWKDLGLHVEDADGTLVPVDDERLAPIIETIGDCGGVAAFHIADPQPFFEPLTPENPRYDQLQEHPDWWFGDRSAFPYDWWQLVRQLETVVERHPETKIMGVHFGCAAEEVWYVADVMRDNPNYIVDVAARVNVLGRHDPKKVRDVFVEFQDRILFGTDLIVREERDQTLEEVEQFYDAHWRYFETDDEAFVPPFDHDWTIDGIDLPRDVLEKLYVENARNHLGLD